MPGWCLVWAWPHPEVLLPQLWPASSGRGGGYLLPGWEGGLAGRGWDIMQGGMDWGAGSAQVWAGGMGGEQAGLCQAVWGSSSGMSQYMLA